MMKPALSRRYNHYLMDFIRDKYGVPKESATRMYYRIGYDYERLEELYREGIGYVPGLYVLMVPTFEVATDQTCRRERPVHPRCGGAEGIRVMPSPAYLPSFLLNSYTRSFFFKRPCCLRATSSR